MKTIFLLQKDCSRVKPRESCLHSVIPQTQNIFITFVQRCTNVIQMFFVCLDVCWILLKQILIHYYDE